jgi:hypothetical protein
MVHGSFIVKLKPALWGSGLNLIEKAFRKLDDEGKYLLCYYRKHE